MTLKTEHPPQENRTKTFGYKDSPNPPVSLGVSAAPKEQESPAALSTQNTWSEGSCHLRCVLLSFQGTWLTASAIRGMFPKRARWQTARGVLAGLGEKEMRLSHQDTIVKARYVTLFQISISLSACLGDPWSVHAFPSLFLTSLSAFCLSLLFGVCWLGFLKFCWGVFVLFFYFSKMLQAGLLV